MLKLSIWIIRTDGREVILPNLYVTSQRLECYDGVYGEDMSDFHHLKVLRIV